MTTTSSQTPLRRMGAPPGGSSLRRTLRYFSRFGFKGGMQAARVHRASSDPIMVRLPELPHPLWVRPGTSDAATFDEVFVAREYDLPFADFEPRHILDLGANVGYASVLFTTRWPNAAILSIEPEAGNMALLKRNTGAYRRINALHAAVWSRATDLVIENPDGAANAFRMTDAARDAGEKIPAFTVAQLIDRFGDERLDLLKMDVEGAEREILRHAAEWIDRVKVMIIELHDRLVPGCAEALYAALRGRHFRQEIVGQNLVIEIGLREPSTE